MRKSGKTTLIIDSAIQKLFSEGVIYVPTKHELINGSKSNYNFIKWIIDPDWNLGSAQNDLLRRLTNRLNTEHPGSAKISGRTITVVQ